jgi:hypothetical protein
MSKEMPAWADRLFEQLSVVVDFPGYATQAGRYTEPDATDWGLDLFELAPGELEPIEAGPPDAVLPYDLPMYGLLRVIDWLVLHDLLAPIDSFALEFDEPRQFHVTLTGRFEARRVAVIIQLTPFEDAEVSGWLDLARDDVRLSWEGDARE